ncbi:DNA-binding response regulator [Virgibacillus halodenitrificans]|uniref:response regulator transcription factor n=1 Tax=Virgibacillus halodenitrificans TaxID=1482 RepID=UPI0002FBA2F4|nr:DNA-binding response regulator [Virgibacillus halodenitrificans]
MNILLIDDEKLELEQLEYLLKPYFPNHTFLRAHDTSEALKIIDKTTIHLALVDIHLPGGSGLKLAEKLKSTTHSKVIIVTAYQSFDYAQQALRLRVDNFITKPVVEAELLDIVRPYINGASYSSIISQAIDLIHENYASRITLTDIASRIHVNHAYLSRKFNDELGVSFPDFLNQYRIEIAKQMLQSENSYTIAEVAERCGFSGQHYFSSLFKKKLGMTPSEFKKEFQK